MVVSPLHEVSKVTSASPCKDIEVFRSGKLFYRYFFKVSQNFFFSLENQSNKILSCSKSFPFLFFGPELQTFEKEFYLGTAPGAFVWGQRLVRFQFQAPCVGARGLIIGRKGGFLFGDCAWRFCLGLAPGGRAGPPLPRWISLPPRWISSLANFVFRNFSWVGFVFRGFPLVEFRFPHFYSRLVSFSAAFFLGIFGALRSFILGFCLISPNYILGFCHFSANYILG